MTFLFELFVSCTDRVIDLLWALTKNNKLTGCNEKKKMTFDECFLRRLKSCLFENCKRRFFFLFLTLVKSSLSECVKRMILPGYQVMSHKKFNPNELTATRTATATETKNCLFFIFTGAALREICIHKNRSQIYLPKPQ